MGSYSLGILLWPLGTGKDCPTLWMQLLRMPRVIFGSSKVSGTWTPWAGRQCPAELKAQLTPWAQLGVSQRWQLMRSE